MNTLLKDLQDLVYQYESKKITKKTLIEVLGNIVKYEEAKKPKKFWLDDYFPEREEDKWSV